MKKKESWKKHDRQSLMHGDVCQNDKNFISGEKKEGEQQMR